MQSTSTVEVAITELCNTSAHLHIRETVQFTTEATIPEPSDKPPHRQILEHKLPVPFQDQKWERKYRKTYS